MSLATPSPTATCPRLLLQAREAVMAHTRPSLREQGLSDQQWRVLRVLGEHGTRGDRPRRARGLHPRPQPDRRADAHGARRPDRRERDPDDQRRTVVAPPRKGCKLVDTLSQTVEAHYAWLEGQLGKPKLSAAVRPAGRTDRTGATRSDRRDACAQTTRKPTQEPRPPALPARRHRLRHAAEFHAASSTRGPRALPSLLTRRPPRPRCSTSRPPTPSARTARPSRCPPRARCGAAVERSAATRRPWCIEIMKRRARSGRRLCADERPVDPARQLYRPPVKFKCLDGFLGIGPRCVPLARPAT